MTLSGALWLGPALLVPLLLAALALLPGLRGRSLSFLPLAPLPALAAALFAPEGIALTAPDILLGAEVTLGGHARLFTGFAAFLWFAAGVFARSSMRGGERLGGFSALWCLTLTGNLGVFLAADVAGFYASFTCVSLAAYPLVVHSRKPPAMRAGLVYIVLALIGEICLLLGFMLAVSGAETVLIEGVRDAIAASPSRGMILLLLVAGFGIKAGLVPLHVWLPLAHPAAPTPASAVLSGAIVKAGIFGLMQFLPAGIALPGWQNALLSAGLFTAFYGVAIGLTRGNPKTILAYSTVSQMGLIIALLATTLQESPPEAAMAAAGLYALHHGLAKGALFLGVGIMAVSGARLLMPVLAVLALPALSLSGFPLTGGALAKLGAKPALGGGTAELLFTLAAIGTALLMVHFLRKIAATVADGPSARPAPGIMLPWLAKVIASLVAPWLLFAPVTGLPSSYPLMAGNLLSAVWPVAVAGGIAAMALLAGARAPKLPEADPIPFLIAFGRQITPGRPAINRPTVASDRIRLGTAAAGWMARSERFLSRWSISGVLLLLIAIVATL